MVRPNSKEDTIWKESSINFFEVSSNMLDYISFSWLNYEDEYGGYIKNKGFDGEISFIHSAIS